MATELNRRDKSILLGSCLGQLTIVPGDGVSKKNERRLGWSLIVVIAVALGGLVYYFLPVFDLGPNAHKIVLLIGMVIFTIFAKILFRLQIATSDSIDVFESGLQIHDAKDSIGGQTVVHWNEVDPHSNRVMIQPASSLVIDKILRCKWTFRLQTFGVAQKSHELSVLFKPEQLELVRFITARLNCTEEQWIGVWH